MTGHHARDFAQLPDHDLCALDVALDFAVNLERSTTNDLEPLTYNLEVVADHRPLSGWSGGAFGAAGGGRIGWARLGLLGLGRRGTRKHEIPQWNSTDPPHHYRITA